MNGSNILGGLIFLAIVAGVIYFVRKRKASKPTGGNYPPRPGGGGTGSPDSTQQQ